MKQFLYGALAALLLSSCNASETQSRAETQSLTTQVGSAVGLVRPTDLTGCEAKPPRIILYKVPPTVKNPTFYNTGSPPMRYQKDITVTIHFENPNKINRDAQGGKPGCTGAVFAYTYPEKKELHLPNPCTYPQTDAYARLACHEMGHANGWPAYHGD